MEFVNLKLGNLG